MGGHPDRPNEDLWGTAGPMAWVLDGASQPPGSACCAFGALGYVASADQTLRTWTGRPGAEDLSLQALLAYVVADASYQHRQYHPTGTVPPPPGPSAAVALARFSGWRCEWAILGDAGIVTGGPHPMLHSDTRLERVAIEERAAWETDPTADTWQAMYEAEQQQRNQWGGYWVLADDIAAGAWAVTGTVHADGQVALVTDGVHRHIGENRLWPTPEAFAAASSSSAGGGRHSPDELLTQLRRHEDTHGLRSDDATVVVVHPHDPEAR